MLKESAVSAININFQISNVYVGSGLIIVAKDNTFYGVIGEHLTIRGNFSEETVKFSITLTLSYPYKGEEKYEFQANGAPCVPDTWECKGKNKFGEDIFANLQLRDFCANLTYIQYIKGIFEKQ